MKKKAFYESLVPCSTTKTQRNRWKWDWRGFVVFGVSVFIGDSACWTISLCNEVKSLLFVSEAEHTAAVIL